MYRFNENDIQLQERYTKFIKKITNRRKTCLNSILQEISRRRWVGLNGGFKKNISIQSTRDHIASRRVTRRDPN